MAAPTAPAKPMRLVSPGFLALLVVGTAALVLVLSLVLFGTLPRAPAHPLLLAFWLMPAAVFALLAFVARWVYVDATKRGHAAGLWAVAVLIAPGLGLVAYLVVREFARR